MHLPVIAQGLRRTFAIAVAVSSALIAVPFVVLGSDPGIEFYACVNGSGTVTGPISTSPVKCPRNTAPVHWNSTGPAGAPGEKGEKGDKGDPGADGTDGIDGQDGADGIDGVDGQDGVDGARIDLLESALTDLESELATLRMDLEFLEAGAESVLTSLDDLQGIACTSSDGPGTVNLTVGSQNTVIIQCLPAGGGGGGGDVEPPICDDGLDFTIDAYVNGSCAYIVDDSLCEDGDPATVDIGDVAAGMCLHINVMEDPDNCGAIGVAIPPGGWAHATYACSEGEVVITGCLIGWADVDGFAGNGCEADQLNGGASCSGNPMPADGTNQANYTCSNGQVVVTSCETGWGDANGLVSDGCEVNLLTSAAHCGSVGYAVPVNGTNHANYTCSNGQVVITGCQTGWANANGLVSDGCELPAGDPDVLGNTQAAAAFLGFRSCDDAISTSLSGSLWSAADHDWYKVLATGGSCTNDFHAFFGGSPGMAYDVITDLSHLTDNGPGPLDVGAGFYTSGAEIWIHVHALPGATDLGGYTMGFNL